MDYNDSECTVKHLWEINHPYYCCEQNYYCSLEQTIAKYKSFAGYLDDNEDENLDLNLIFRWDWDEVDDDGEPVKFNGDIYHRNGKLSLFYMGQRRGLYRCTIIDVCRADEESVKIFLRKRWEKIKELWEPF